MIIIYLFLNEEANGVKIIYEFIEIMKTFVINKEMCVFYFRFLYFLQYRQCPVFRMKLCASNTIVKFKNINLLFYTWLVLVRVKSPYGYMKNWLSDDLHAKTFKDIVCLIWLMVLLSIQMVNWNVFYSSFFQRIFLKKSLY